MRTSRFIFHSVAALLIALIPAWQYPDEARAFRESWLLWHEPVIAGAVCGIITALIGVYTLVNRIVFVSLAVAQSAGLGIFFSFFIAGLWHLHIEDSPAALASGFITATIAALTFANVKRLRHIPVEVLIGLAYVFSSGLIVLIGDRLPEGRHHIDALLFGNAVAVTRADLNVIGLVTIVMLITHVFYRREFAYTSADPDFMRLKGMNSGHWQTLLSLTLTLSITVSLKTLGSLPVFALMLAPPFIALRYANGLREAFALSLFLGLIIPPLGYYLSFVYALPTGASVVLVCCLYALWGAVESRTLAVSRKPALT